MTTKMARKVARVVVKARRARRAKEKVRAVVRTTALQTQLVKQAQPTVAVQTLESGKRSASSMPVVHASLVITAVGDT